MMSPYHYNEEKKEERMLGVTELVAIGGLIIAFLNYKKGNENAKAIEHVNKHLDVLVEEGHLTHLSNACKTYHELNKLEE